MNYSPSRTFAPFNATIRVWLFSVPEFDGKGVYLISVYGRLSLPPHTLYRFKTVSDAYVVFMTCIFQRYGHLPRILAQVKMIFLAERKFVSNQYSLPVISAPLLCRLLYFLIFGWQKRFMNYTVIAFTISLRTIYNAPSARFERATFANYVSGS